MSKVLNGTGRSLMNQVLRLVSTTEQLSGTETTVAAPIRNKVVATTNLAFRTAKEIGEEVTTDAEWIAYPWIAAGAITEVGGKPKAAGKTTWLMRLIRDVLDGSEFMGGKTTKTPVVYLTEERSRTFRESLKRADLLEREDLFVLHWHQTIGGGEKVKWKEVVRLAIEECQRRNSRLLVVDTVSQFSDLRGDAENNAGDALDAIRPLQEASAKGIAVVAVRHERKGGGQVGDAGRGSSAFAGAADIVLSIRRPEGNTRSTIREIHALSRFDETPECLAIELTDDGYNVLGDSAAVAEAEAEEKILRVLPSVEADAIDLKTLQKVADVGRTTAQKTLERLTKEGRVAMIGAGKRGDAHRYYRVIDSALTSSISEAEQFSGDQVMAMMAQSLGGDQ